MTVAVAKRGQCLFTSLINPFFCSSSCLQTQLPNCEGRGQGPRRWAWPQRYLTSRWPAIAACTSHRSAGMKGFNGTSSSTTDFFRNSVSTDVYVMCACFLQAGPNYRAPAGLRRGEVGAGLLSGAARPPLRVQEPALHHLRHAAVQLQRPLSAGWP